MVTIVLRGLQRKGWPVCQHTENNRKELEGHKAVASKV